jgi:hypothetical protein
VSSKEFIDGFVAKVRAKSADLAKYGAEGHAQLCAQIASELESEFHEYWLTELPITEAAKESGYSEDRLRKMVRDNVLPHRKGGGTKGHLFIARKDLPKRPQAQEPALSSVGERLLRPQHLRKPA